MISFKVGHFYCFLSRIECFPVELAGFGLFHNQIDCVESYLIITEPLTVFLRKMVIANNESFFCVNDLLLLFRSARLGEDSERHGVRIILGGPFGDGKCSVAVVQAVFFI